VTSTEPVPPVVRPRRTPRPETVVLPEPGAKVPTSLKPVIDVIPARCYERSTARGLGLLARDVTVWGLVVWGLASTNNPLLLVPLWLLSALAVSGLFILGHDAAHLALFDSRRLNDLVARVTMLPSLHITEAWVLGHNRIHHGHTLREGMDFVWHPLTPEQYAELPRWARWRHRLEWGPFGSGAYYLRDVWWNKMIAFRPPERWAPAIRRDRRLVVAFVVVTGAGAVALAGPIGGLWLWVKAIGVPFLLFCQVIGWVVHVHHISPRIRWWKRRDWNKFRGQVEGTTVLWGPPGWDLFFHWIMVHLPHHVDMRIPCYRLPEAARAIAETWPDQVDERPIRVRDYLDSTRACKLYDFDAQRWLTYDEAAARTPA
jgi:acyl-lipid omega-6 desaturase (Delta-12 desaturase)